MASGVAPLRLPVILVLPVKLDVILGIDGRTVHEKAFCPVDAGLELTGSQCSTCSDHLIGGNDDIILNGNLFGNPGYLPRIVIKARKREDDRACLLAR